MNREQKNALPTRTLKSPKGFTLVEILIAIAVLAFGILAIASMQITSLDGTAGAQRITEAISVAQDRVEKFVNAPYNDLELTAGTHSDPNPPAGFTVQWNVTKDTPINNTKTVVVTVSWRAKGVMKSISLTYLKMDKI